MIHVTRPDVVWLSKLLGILEYFYREFPEEFNEEDEEVIKVAGELIKGLNK